MTTIDLKIIRKAALAASILCLSFISQAKNQFKEAVVFKDGKALSGYIEVQKWKVNPTDIRFRSPETNKVQVLTPHDVDRFEVNGKIFESRVVNVEVSRKDDMELGSSIHPQLRSDTVFVEVLKGGAKPLYMYKDRSYNEHFYIAKDNKLELLIHKRYITQNAEGEGVVRHNNLYKKQLLTYMSDCGQMFAPIASVNYTKSELTKVFTSYTQCNRKK